MNYVPEEFNSTELLTNIGAVLRKYPNVDLSDALSKGQVESKWWLIDQLAWEANEGHLPGNGMVFILGGWYGTLALMMLESKKFHIMTIRSFDIDPACAPIADTMNKYPWVADDWQFKATTQDMNQINYSGHHYKTLRADGSSVELYDTPDVIINTSCEHLLNFNYWWNLIPKGKLCALQSNNFHGGEGHVNVVESLNEFLTETHFSQVLYSGELDLEKYTRYMIIGRK